MCTLCTNEYGGAHAPISWKGSRKRLTFVDQGFSLLRGSSRCKRSCGNPDPSTPSTEHQTSLLSLNPEPQPNPKHLTVQKLNKVHHCPSLSAASISLGSSIYSFVRSLYSSSVRILVSTRRGSTHSSKVNLHHAINFRTLCAANFVT